MPRSAAFVNLATGLKRTVGGRYRALQHGLARLTVERGLPHDPERYVAIDDLGVDGRYNRPYMASPRGDVRRALRLAAPRADDVFADLGCGVGRVVDLAARARFRRVLGVDLSEELCRLAQENVSANRTRYRTPEVEVVCADLGKWALPDDVTLVYYYNSVIGPVFDAMLDQIAASHDRRPRRLMLLYVNPEGAEQVHRHPRFELVSTSEARRKVPERRIMRFDVVAA